MKDSILRTTASKRSRTKAVCVFPEQMSPLNIQATLVAITVVNSSLRLKMRNFAHLRLMYVVLKLACDLNSQF